MPYYITDSHPDCSGWGTVKDDGELMGCHDTKQDAINQALAIAQAEGSTFEGERAVRVSVLGVDKFTTEAEALARADELGCEGTHTMDEDGQTIYMPCSTHAVYDELASMEEGRPYHTDKDKKKNRRDVIESPGGGLPDNYRPATSPDVPEGRACGNCFYFNERDVAPDGRARCMQWGEYVEGGFVCNAWKPRTGDNLGGPYDEEKEVRPYHDDEDEDRVAPDAVAVGDYVSWNSSGGRARGRITRIVRDGTLNVPDTDFTLNADEENPAALIRVYERVRDGWEPRGPIVGHRFATLTKIEPLPEATPEEGRDVDTSPPEYVRAAARQGLEFHGAGLSGDGVTAQTVREARLMADGQVSEDKAVRVSAWAARHAVDLQADGASPDEDGYPTPGAVAHLLWGIPTGARYGDAVAFWDNLADRIREQERGMEKTPVKPRTEGSGVEFRSFEGEIRADGDGRTFVGYAAVFNSDSQPLPFIERISPSAFAKTLKNRRRDVRLYINHNSDMVLASKNSGTLRLSEDERGLRVEADLPNTTSANDLRELMRSGVVSKMSFGFTIPRGGDSWSDDGTTRTLREITLHEVSVVTGFPAYEATAAAVRSLEHLAERTGLQVDELSEALDALASGDEIEPSKAQTLMDALQQSMPKPKQVEQSDGNAGLLALQSKKLDLISKLW